MSHPDHRLHRVLAGDSRARLLGVLRQLGRPATVAELADASGLHVDTVRAHLDMLASVGYASRETKRRTTPGRPRVVYRATLKGVLPSEVPDQRSESMELLARVLAAQVSDRSRADGDRRGAPASGRRVGP